MKTIKVESWDEVPKNYTGIVEFGKGHTYWLLNRKFHRVDGPAIEYIDGHVAWFLNDEQMTKKEYTERTRYMRATLGKLIWKGG